MANLEKPLVDEIFLLQKIPGKGGWTYADLPKVMPDSGAPFGWVKVRGTIDGIAINKYHLMPYGSGKLFLPVNAGIRKRIKKEAGDYVHVVLYPDPEPVGIPEEMLLCLQDEPEAFRFFNSLEENEKHNYVKWIYAAKSEQVKVLRLASASRKLSQGLKYRD